MLMGRNHEIIKTMQNCVVVTGGNPVAHLRRFEARERVYVRSL